MKKFNTTAVCIPSKHYMVDLSERVASIKKMIDAGDYFTINRARQYGKTTTLNELRKALEDSYFVLDLSFEGITTANFETEESFVRAFCRLVKEDPLFYRTIPDEIKNQFEDYLMRERPTSMDALFLTLGEWCALSDTPLVLFIDEVDSATNNQVFLDFLALLRDKYIKRERRGLPAFQSVILAGVTDVKHLKRKIRDDADAKQNSPWNTHEGDEENECLHSFDDHPWDHMAKPYDIAADFTIDMSLPEDGIAGMLDEYEADHHIGMDTGLIAKTIREYTSGYPFLVSRICQLIDERLVPNTFGSLSEAWTEQGIDEAVKLLLTESNTLFQSLTKNLDNSPELKAGIRSVLMEGARIPYNSQQDDIARMHMYGLIRNKNNAVCISNRIFEMMLYNLFLSDEELKNNIFFREGDLARNIFVEDGKLNMRLILKRFAETYTEIFGPLEEKFKEKDGRELFLLYLRPIINGTGNYYIETQTRDQTRTDVVVDYLGQQYIVELKIWRGERYNADGEKQISEYLDYFGLTTGYMLSFNFNKNKEPGVKQVRIGDKVLYETVI